MILAREEEIFSVFQLHFRHLDFFRLKNFSAFFVAARPVSVISRPCRISFILRGIFGICWNISATYFANLSSSWELLCRCKQPNLWAQVQKIV